MYSGMVIMNIAASALCWRTRAPCKLPLTSAPNLVQAVATKQTRAVGTGVYGAGPAAALEGAQKTVFAAQVFLAVGIVFALFGAAVFFLAARRGVLADIRRAPLADVAPLARSCTGHLLSAWHEVAVLIALHQEWYNQHATPALSEVVPVDYVGAPKGSSILHG